MSASSVQQIPFSSYTPRVAIVTGGAQGIGYAISRRLADDGFDVAINDVEAKKDQVVTVVEELAKKGRRAIAVPGDVSSEADVVRATLVFAGLFQAISSSTGAITPASFDHDEVVFVCIKVFMLEHGQKQQDSGEEVYRDTFVNNAMLALLSSTPRHPEDAATS